MREIEIFTELNLKMSVKDLYPENLKIRNYLLPLQYFMQTIINSYRNVNFITIYSGIIKTVMISREFIYTRIGKSKIHVMRNINLKEKTIEPSGKICFFITIL